ncbi:hypothetical protein KY285_016081 [Solanum tuberosum]|nr:hypothetical protein KY285_016081 [Solanum tuberosum]
MMAFPRVLTSLKLSYLLPHLIPNSSPAPLSPVQRMVTRTQTGTLKPKLPFSLSAITHSSEEPTCYSQATKDNHWRCAMAEEYNALIQNGTWELVPPSSQNSGGKANKATTIKLLLSLAVTRGWNITQLDISNVFLHGHLDEVVYMSQPPGFVDPSHSDHVCMLKRSLYCLKQAPHMWNKRISDALFSLGFQD